MLTQVGDRVLVKDQADQTQNGIYTASEGQWFRAADARTARTLQKGTTVHVQEGAASADRVYAFETLDPVIGADPITLSFYLSQDTLGDAVNAANAAAASAAAALTSKTAAATSATNAAGSATAAAGSATAASTSAANAAASATNAGNSATAAAGSASTAAGSATSAGTSASAAAGSASAASSSATAASGSATNAATSAANAAASAVAAANAVAALGYTFSTGTADADPGNGTLRLNNASAASATAAYIDNLDSSGATVSGILDTFDDSTNTIKGQLTLRSKASAAIAYVYNVTGSVVDGTGYRKLTLAYVSGAGTLPTSADGIWLIFTRAGDKGADGTGVGDFTGPASSATDNIVTFAGTTGKAGKDSGVAVGSLVAGPASAAADNIATFNGTTGKVVKDSGVAVGSLAPKASPALTGTPTAPTAAAGTNSTQIATTAYVDVTFAPKGSPTFTGTPTAPTATSGTNTAQIATTGFVKAAIDLVLGGVSAAFDTLSEIATAMLQKAADNLGITAGFTSTSVNDGTKASGTYAPSPIGGNLRYLTNGGAFTLAAPTQAGDFSMVVQIINSPTAGAITFTGFVVTPGGNALTTTSGSKFNLYITKLNGAVSGSIEALQ
ncbi:MULTISPECIES: hypothetical protein [unclassified Mesorhizobium]|uniref:hypothetical protein n=1 Tax=unclassified Mesorhizobium TaxID=325217 RepID=UPI000FD725DC|nr:MULTISPECIES: hypothetical protein [unclassified Mesorhizobium]TGQ12500.1 hypothetical protein EN862_016660 [Mesorhizobium sp. M2E.F.Ca.ET.219.01.1.1]TGT68324.1 hypothetical protein EN809_027935 [Mesorhizobium sp. M2E.F.Ca.ET.166.01.1.1]TGW01325.1 hypothetical protein EN797_013245 [Mesorhizobium sp. M2E.F.Ca.ET.154.01.1.1]